MKNHRFMNFSVVVHISLASSNFFFQYHDSSWLRRPRSRMGSNLTSQNSVGSRCATPLSRQNSMSMEDFTTSMPALSSANGPRDRVTSSARFGNRRSNPGSPRKSVSIDSLHQHSQVTHKFQKNITFSMTKAIHNLILK